MQRHRWQGPGRAQWRCKQRFTKQRLLPGSRSVSHQSQSHHHAVLNVMSRGMLMPSLEGLLLNNELQILRVIYVYIRDNRNNRRNPHTAYEHGEREWMLLTGSCGCNYVYCRNVWRDTQLPLVLQYKHVSPLWSPRFTRISRVVIDKLLFEPMETHIS